MENKFVLEVIELEIRKEILCCIVVVEQEYGVKVFYVVELGSCVWGFVSFNSDYDVWFIYVYLKEWYLIVDVEDKCDVIEYLIVDEIDINGWDVRKVFKLFWKFNLVFVEWFQFLIVYVDDGYFVVKV